MLLMLNLILLEDGISINGALTITGNLSVSGGATATFENTNSTIKW